MNALTVKLRSIDDKVMFSAEARENPEIIIDYFPPVGKGEGYTSLELLMASFGSCVSTALVTLLRHRMRKQVEGISARLEGRMREEHPKKLEHIALALQIKAQDLSEAEAHGALKIAEDKMCPVWAMLKGNVEVDVTIEIV